MSKKPAKAPCPVCGFQIEDDDAAVNSPQRRVIRCPNCQSNLEWRRPWWRRFNLVHWLIVYIPAWATAILGKPQPDSPYSHIYHLVTTIGFVCATILMGAVVLEKFVGRQASLIQSQREYQPGFFERLREQRRQRKEVDAMRLPADHVPPEYLRGRSPIGPDPSTGRDAKWGFKA